MRKWQSWALTGFGGVFVALVLVNMYLFTSNRSLQRDINGRQQFIQQSVQLEQLNKEIIMALANLSVRDKDDDLSQLLVTHGITVSATPTPVAEPGDRGTSKPPRER